MFRTMAAVAALAIGLSAVPGMAETVAAEQAGAGTESGSGGWMVGDRAYSSARTPSFFDMSFGAPDDGASLVEGFDAPCCAAEMLDQGIGFGGARAAD